MRQCEPCVGRPARWAEPLHFPLGPPAIAAKSETLPRCPSCGSQSVHSRPLRLAGSSLQCGAAGECVLPIRAWVGLELVTASRSTRSLLELICFAFPPLLLQLFLLHPLSLLHFVGVSLDHLRFRASYTLSCTTTHSLYDPRIDPITFFLF